MTARPSKPPPSPPTPTTRPQRSLTALAGGLLAVGDAFGTTLEFTDRDEQPHHTEITGGGPLALGAGIFSQWYQAWPSASPIVS